MPKFRLSTALLLFIPLGLSLLLLRRATPIAILAVAFICTMAIVSRKAGPIKTSAVRWFGAALMLVGGVVGPLAFLVGFSQSMAPGGETTPWLDDAILGALAAFIAGLIVILKTGPES